MTRPYGWGGDRIGPRLTNQAGEFCAKLGTLVITDRDEYERLARTYASNPGQQRTSLRVGDEVLFDVWHDGNRETVRGHVWGLAPQRGEYWVRGENERTYRFGKLRGWQRQSRMVTEVDNRTGAAV